MMMMFFPCLREGSIFKAPLSELLSEPAQIPFSFFLVQRSRVLEEHSQEPLCLPVACRPSLEN